MKKNIKSFVLSLALTLAMVVFALPSISWGSCETEEVIIHNKYLGACGYTDSSSFTLDKDTYITRIRIWYDTYIGGDTLSATLSGPNGYTNSSGEITKEGCYGDWCAAMFNINQILKAGTYNLKASSKSVCSNPSGATTLILYGCDAEEQLPDDNTEGINPPNGISTVDANANPNNAPVYMGNIVSSGGVSTLSSNMELSVSFPAYNKPVDIWILIALPDGRFYTANESGKLLSFASGDLAAIASGVSGTKTENKILTPFEIGTSNTAFEPWPADGAWSVYWLVAPESSGNIYRAIENGDYELGFYSFEVNNNNSEDNQKTEEIGVSGGVISFSGINLNIPQDAFSDLRTIAIQKTSLLSEQEDLSDTYTITGLPYTINGEIVLDIQSTKQLDATLVDKYYVRLEIEENMVMGINYISSAHYLLKAETIGNNTLRITLPTIDFQPILDQEKQKSHMLRARDDWDIGIKAVQYKTLSTDHFTTAVKNEEVEFANKTLGYLEEIYNRLGNSVDKGGFGFNWVLANCRINSNTFQYEKIPVVFADGGKDGALGGYNAGLSGWLGAGGPCNITALSAVLEFNTNAEANSGNRLKATAAHELFHFLQEIYTRATITEPWAEASSMWIETVFGKCPSENQHIKFAQNGLFNVYNTAVEPVASAWDKFVSGNKLKRRWHGYEASNIIMYGVSKDVFDVETFWDTLHEGTGEIDAFKKAIQKKNNTLTLNDFWKEFALEVTTKGGSNLINECLPPYTSYRWKNSITDEKSFPISYSFDAFPMSFHHTGLKLSNFTTSKKQMSVVISTTGLIDGQEMHIHDFNSGGIKLGVITSQSNKLTITNFENYQKLPGPIVIVFIDKNIPSGTNPSESAQKHTNSVVVNIDTDTECSDSIDYSKLTKVEKFEYYTNDNALYYINAAGQRHGLYKSWYDKSRTQPSGECFYCYDNLEGPYISWSENGNKIEEGRYKDNQKTGFWTEYWYSYNGTKSYEGAYMHGKKEGLWTAWHTNGNKFSEGEYSKHLQTGLWTYWHFNGNKQEQGSFTPDYEKGLNPRNGLWTYWYENGNKKAEGNYTNGVETGVWTVWNEDGSIRYTMSF